MADIFHLLIAAATQSSVDIVGAVRDKFEENKRRKWGKPNAEGYVEHVPAPPARERLR